MRRENYKQKTPGFGHQWNACMSLVSSQRIIIETVHMKRGFSDNQDQRGDSNEELSHAMGEEGTDYQRDRC